MINYDYKLVLLLLLDLTP